MFQDIAIRTFVAAQFAFSRSASERGQTLAEYSLIMTIIAVAVVTLSVLTFREALTEAWGSATQCLGALGSCS